MNEHIRSSEEAPIIELDRVSLSFEARGDSFEHHLHTVLKEVSLSLFQGETLGIIGRNGCGKTSMLRVMAGIFAPSSGQIKKTTGVTVSLLTVGLGFKPHLSGRDNALLAAMLQGASSKQAHGFLHEINEFAELGRSFDEPVNTYSAGMRSRLGFATALMTQVDVLLVDEILSVGDAQFRAKAEAAMRQRLSSEQTVVFVSHAAPQVKSLCNRVIWIEQGVIASEGDPETVLTAYADAMKVKKP